MCSAFIGQITCNSTRNNNIPKKTQNAFVIESFLTEHKIHKISNNTIKKEHFCISSNRLSGNFKSTYKTTKNIQSLHLYGVQQCRRFNYLYVKFTILMFIRCLVLYLHAHHRQPSNQPTKLPTVCVCTPFFYATLPHRCKRVSTHACAQHTCEIQLNVPAEPHSRHICLNPARVNVHESVRGTKRRVCRTRQLRTAPTQQCDLP